MKKLAIIIILISAAACNPYEIEKVLLPREDISLTLKGVEQFTYDPVTCQLAHNITTNEYRAFNDTLADWFTIRCNTMPASVGQEVTAEVSWMAGKVNRTMKNLTFSVEKTDNTGKIWMWCDQKSIGIVIKNL